MQGNQFLSGFAVFFVLGSPQDLAYVLLLADTLGMLNGEYVFIGETEADTG
jgi:hypothetical protein